MNETTVSSGFRTDFIHSGYQKRQFWIMILIFMGFFVAALVPFIVNYLTGEVPFLVPVHPDLFGEWQADDQTTIVISRSGKVSLTTNENGELRTTESLITGFSSS